VGTKDLRKRDRCVCKIKTRYWKRTQKYGVELPKSVKQAVAIDSRTEPTFTFRDDDKVPVGYKKIACHMVFDVKIDLTRKARLVAGGNQTDVPKESVNSSVVPRDFVRIALTIASLNNCSVC
jgi:hypothetical protein